MVKKSYGEDGIGEWSELKLECIKKYVGAYTNILKCARYGEFYFLDLFSSAGCFKSRTTKQNISGSPKVALAVKPPFSKYYFFELDHNKINELEDIRKSSPLKDQIFIIEGDCNKKITDVLGSVGDNIPFLALLDPQAGDLFWKTLMNISKKSKSEVLINFPLGMAITRYMPLAEGKDISKEMEKRIDQIFGNANWRLIYQERKKKKIDAPTAREKYLDLYLYGLVSIGYKYYAVKRVYNSKNNLIYYLIFGTKNLRGLEKMTEILVKDDHERDTLFFLQDLRQKIYKVFAGKENLNLHIILERLLAGKRPYRVQDFKDALKALEKEGKLYRVNKRDRARSFNEKDVFNFV